MNFPPYFTIEKRVVYTFIRNGISRKECSWIMRCSVHTIDTHIENLRKDVQAFSEEQALCNCADWKWIRCFTLDEINHYKQIADSNMKRRARRQPGEPIQWQEIHNQLYPS